MIRRIVLALTLVACSSSTNETSSASTEAITDSMNLLDGHTFQSIIIKPSLFLHPCGETLTLTRVAEDQGDFVYHGVSCTNLAVSDAQGVFTLSEGVIFSSTITLSSVMTGALPDDAGTTFKIKGDDNDPYLVNANGDELHWQH